MRSPIPSGVLPPILLVSLAAGCIGNGTMRGAPAREPAIEELSTIAPPEGWETVSPWGFEQLAMAWPPADSDPRLDSESLTELRAALSTNGELAVRAAVLLGRSQDPLAGAVLLGRLEERVEHGARHEDAGDVVAAGALWDWNFTPDAGERLGQLAVGERVHPDLEVRIECAAGALQAGHDEVIPFLLRVLHAQTPAELDDPPDWTPTMTMAWSKSRAAEALSRRAGLEPAFRPDGSYAHQMEEAERLARALGR